MTLKVNGAGTDSATPSGAAGGDLGGTYPNPTVTDLTIASEARGDLLRRNASAWGRFAANTADTFVGGDGTDVTTRTAAQARASILGPFADGMTGTGWSNIAGSGSHTETWGSGKLTLTLATGSAASGGVSRTDFRTTALAGGAAIRVDVITGDTGTQRQVYLALGKDSSNGPAFALYGDGTVVASATIGGSYASLASVAGPDASQRTGGQLWLAVVTTGAAVVWAWGVGSGGALPTSWTVIHSSTTVAHVNASAGTYGQIGVVTDASIDWSVDVLAISSFLAGAV